MITELIDKQDTFELVRDQIAALLVAESANQMALAETAGKDPKQWQLRVFTERSKPWEEFRDATEAKTPIVNVAIDSMSFDKAASNRFQKQKADGIFHLEVFANGVATGTDAGHTPGDKASMLNAQAATRLVRNIIMAAVNHKLQMRGTVWDRWISNIQFYPADPQVSVENVGATRLTLEVEYHETDPQVQPETLQYLAHTLIREETGEVFAQVDFDYTESN